MKTEIKAKKNGKIYFNTAYIKGLEQNGQSTDFANRKRIAKLNGVKNYDGRSSQHRMLEGLARTTGLFV